MSEIRRLHPNLAQIAAAYDDICEQHARHQLTQQQARERILALVARDDQGVQWLIAPDDGSWYRVTQQGQLVRDEPPTWGVATLTAHDLSSGNDPLGNPARRVWKAEVDPTVLTGDGLAGSTIAHAARSLRPAAGDQNHMKVVLYAVVAAALLVIAFMALRGTPDTDPVPAAPTTTLPGPGGS